MNQSQVLTDDEYSLARTMISDDRLQAGPWFAHGDGKIRSNETVGPDDPDDAEGTEIELILFHASTAATEEDVQFAARSRELVPKLLDRIDALQNECVSYRRLVAFVKMYADNPESVKTDSGITGIGWVDAMKAEIYILQARLAGAPGRPDVAE